MPLFHTVIKSRKLYWTEFVITLFVVIPALALSAAIIYSKL